MTRTRLALLLFALLCLLSACGKKGPVRPLEEKLPQAVEDARILQRGEGFQLQWKMPRVNQDGSPVEIEYINIERLHSTEAEFCSECPTPWPLMARIHPQLPAPAQRIRDIYLISDQSVAPGLTARYRLKVRNKQGDFGTPLILKQVSRTPVSAPDEIHIKTFDQSVELHWQPTTPPSGATLIGYQVYRRQKGSPFSPVPTTLRPLKKPEFSDFSLENNQQYYYRVRSLFDFGGQQLESLPSTELSATPVAG